MKIAICDDEKSCRDRVLDIAADYTEERRDRSISFEAFSDPEALLRRISDGDSFDIYILDIVMHSMNGIVLGQALRENDSDAKIIYLTSSEEYALESFRVRAFNYLLKPITKDTFYSALDEATSSVSVKRDPTLVIKTKENSTRIAFDSILYAERSKRSVIYHLTNGHTVESTSLRTTFSEAVEKLISDNRFVLCGASMAVNMHHITMVENDGIVFDNSKRVFLGVKACRELRAVWSNYWISEGGEN